MNQNQMLILLRFIFIIGIVLLAMMICYFILHFSALWKAFNIQSKIVDIISSNIKELSLTRTLQKEIEILEKTILEVHNVKSTSYPINTSRNNFFSNSKKFTQIGESNIIREGYEQHLENNACDNVKDKITDIINNNKTNLRVTIKEHKRIIRLKESAENENTEEKKLTIFKDALILVLQDMINKNKSILEDNIQKIKTHEEKLRKCDELHAKYEKQILKLFNPVEAIKLIFLEDIEITNLKKQEMPRSS